MRAERNAKKITWTRRTSATAVLSDGSRSYCYRYRDAEGVQRCIFLGKGSTEREAIDAFAGVTVAARRVTRSGSRGNRSRGSRIGGSQIARST